jgi:L-amino acid N-acyltransferase YncA
MAAVRDIYAHYVLHSLATFEETPPTLDEMLMRRRASVDLGLPYLVAETGGEILGFGYAASYRPRPAYRFTVEDSVYVADGLGRQGRGSALLGELIARCEGGPWRQMLAVGRRQRQFRFDRAPSALRFRARGNVAFGRFQVRPLGRHADPAENAGSREGIGGSYGLSAGPRRTTPTIGPIGVSSSSRSSSGA